MSDYLFLKACKGEKTERAPVWMMRQAGRYLPEYRAVRAGHSFTEMYKTPDLAVEVTIQPIDILNVDAAILFSDILVVPEAMGMKLEFHEGRGPVLPQPLRDEKDIQQLSEKPVSGELGFVFDAIKKLRRELDGRVPLIGFSGAPWTLATYMVEGGGSKNFTFIKTLRYDRPDLLKVLLKKLEIAVIDYCKVQIESGAQAIQIFDSWAGNLDSEGYLEFVLPGIKNIIAALKPSAVPLIYFPRGSMHLLEHIKSCAADVIGLDWSVAPAYALNAIQKNTAVQGNLDPVALYSKPQTIRHLVKKMIRDFLPAKGYVANLGHGILPDIPVEHARTFIESVKEESSKQYQNK